MGRTEALKEIDMLINRTNQAYDNLSNATLQVRQAAIGQAEAHVAMYSKILLTPFFIH